MNEEEKRRILNTAEKLRPMVATEGWEYVKAYILVRVEGLKNKLVNIDLSDKLGEASSNQGEIKALKRVVNNVDEVIQKAKRIEEDEINKKKKEKK